MSEKKPSSELHQLDSYYYCFTVQQNEEELKT